MKLKTLTAPVLLLGALFLIQSCGNSKKLSKTEGRKEIETPFSANKYKSDKNHFRAKNYGKSPDLGTAKKIAMQNAKSEIASNIQSTIKTVTDNYTNQRTIGSKQEFENKFEELSRNVVNQKLSNIHVIDEKTFELKDGKYEYWVALEISKDALIEGINDQISKNKKLQLDYDKHKYEETFNKEMEKFEQENY
jgi:hypothetical protein